MKITKFRGGYGSSHHIRKEAGLDVLNPFGVKNDTDDVTEVAAWH